jgi:cholestanetriol 26-monooxygenase
MLRIFTKAFHTPKQVGARFHSEDIKSTTNLQNIRSLPLVGSTIPMISNIPAFDNTKIYSFWPKLREEYGDFYTIGIPGIGQGSEGKVYVIQDPKLMLKVIQQEGKYPFGQAELQWAFVKYIHKDGTAAKGLVGNGQDWKWVRSFLQNDLLSPAAAKRYLPGLIKAAQYSSKGAQKYALEGKLNEYLLLASFDMFITALMGSFPRITDPSAQTLQEDVEFCKHVVNTLRLSGKLTTSPSEILKNKIGIESSVYKEFNHHADQTMKIARDKLDRFITKRETGVLTSEEESCYFYNAIERQKSNPSISLNDARDISAGLMLASVDTTGGMLSWMLCHLAQNPDVQENIFKELQLCLENGKLVPLTFDIKNSPYLNAFIREVHRITPSNPIMIKRVDSDLEMYGEILGPGTKIVLDTYSPGIDPINIDDPLVFRPENFLPEAVLLRKGTNREVVDNVLFNGPFSQGARRCPGSRVAKSEAMILIAQLVLDWKLHTDVNDWRDVRYDVETLITCKLPKIDLVPRQ